MVVVGLVTVERVVFCAFTERIKVRAKKRCMKMEDKFIGRPNVEDLTKCERAEITVKSERD